MKVILKNGKSGEVKKHSLAYDIGDVVNIIRPGSILPKATVVNLFGLKVYSDKELAEYPKGLQDKSWKIADVKSNYPFELCILLVNRNKEYVAIAHKVDSSSCMTLDATPPIEIIRKSNKLIPTIEICSKY